MGQIKNIKLHIVTDIKGGSTANNQNDYPKEKPCRYLREPLQGWSNGRSQGLQPPKAQRAGESEKPGGNQGHAVAKISWLRARELRMEALLLVLDQRGNPIPARLPSPST